MERHATLERHAAMEGHATIDAHPKMDAHVAMEGHATLESHAAMEGHAPSWPGNCWLRLLNCYGIILTPSMLEMALAPFLAFPSSFFFLASYFSRLNSCQFARVQH